MKKYKYKISVIMSIYNTEEYIVESIESLIKQSIGFEENVQLILVNDGSTDNVEPICLRYVGLYPNNVVYVKKENGGLSSARNVGLKYIEGEYITFTDPDDLLSRNCFENVYNFFNRNKLCVDLVTIPLYMFGAQIGIHGKYKYMGNKNRIINLIEEPYNFVLSAAASFYKNEIIRKMKFDETMLGAEDIKFNTRLYQKNPKIGYVCERGVKYHYRKRFEQTSIVDSLKTSKIGFESVVKVLKLFNINKLYDYEKEIIIYELRSRLKNINEMYFEDKKEYNQLLKQYGKYLNAIPEQFILNQSKWSDTLALKLKLLSFRNISYEDLIKDNKISIKQNVVIKNYYIEKNKFIIELVFNNYGYNNLDVVSYDGNNNIYEYSERKDLDAPYNIYYGKTKIDDTHYRKFVFDINKNRIIKFILLDRSTNVYYPINNLMVDKLTRLALRDKNLILRTKNRAVRLSGRKFKISEYKRSTLFYNLKTTLEIYKKYKYKAYARLLSKRKKKYILVNDRPEKAGDNGEAIFKYINYNRPDMAKYTYYVVDKKSPDYNRLKKIGKVVSIRSIKHRILFLNCKYIYSSHNHKLFFNAFGEDNIKYYSDLFNYKFVWLQHGIIKDDLSPQANRLNTKNNYMVVSTNDEFSEIIQEKYFFDEEKLILTGLARYDYLIDNSQNIITICPTWRKSLSGIIQKDGSHATIKGFENSDYYNNYKTLLTNKKLNNLLKKNDYKLNFILHPGMDGYKEYFECFKNDNINILKQADVVYSKVFAESKLLITDFSSVFFDFAYLKKPEIFFQFDRDTFFEEHYKQGYFTYEEHAFGDVIDNADEVVEKIEFYFKNNFKMEKKYLTRVEKTFKYTDQNNSKRIIDTTYKK